MTSRVDQIISSIGNKLTNALVMVSTPPSDNIYYSTLLAVRLRGGSISC